MRDAKDYSTTDWLSLTPLVHLFKRHRNDLIQNAFLRRRPKSLDSFLQNSAHLEGQNISLVVAYQQPWTLAWLARMAKRHCSDSALLVFDNSRCPQSRLDIERVCQDHEIPYLALPPNPERHPNRSHGSAMTWIYHNVVRAIEPQIFSFIDHDLIPMEPIAFSETLGDQPFYGLPRFNKWGWSLWAGYCIYNFSAVSHLPLNFLIDIPRVLDTGGRNWTVLYNQHDRYQLRFAETRHTAITDPIDGTQHPVQIVDGNWIHLNGASYKSSFREMLPFYERIATAADEGATLGMLDMTMKQQHSN